jgi:glutamate racemase
MKIGIFDSGLGGLLIAKSIFSRLPKYNYIYLGDTINLPYGEKTPAQIYRFTKNAVDYLFKQDCQLVIVACNTSSALALRKLQKEYLPENYPDRRILGVVVPTLEVADKNKQRKIGVVGTTATIKSHIYKKELLKIDKKARIYELATPKLVPLIEANSLQQAEKALTLYLQTLKNKKIQALILGCTHYPILKQVSRKVVGNKVEVISQDEIIPAKLAEYLKRHPEIEKKVAKLSTREFFVTKINKNFSEVSARLFGKKLKLKLVKLSFQK